MSFTKKRPTFLRFVFTLFGGLIVSGGILMLVQQFYQQYIKQSALRVPFFYLTGISTLLIALFLVFPANKPYRLFKWLSRLVIMVLVVTLLWGIGGFYIAQNHMIYMPGRRDMGAEAYLAEQTDIEEFQINQDDKLTLNGYLWKTTPEKAGLILYFGGNGELAAGRMMSLKQNQAEDFLAGYHVMMVDYPGYGKSGGEPTEESIYQMAQLSYDYALSRKEVDGSKIVLIGWSLGSGSASMLASKNQIAGLVLMTPFYNGTELLQNFVKDELKADNMLTTIAGWLTRNKYPSDLYAKTASANARVLVLGGKKDTLIPYEQAERLSTHFPNAEFVLLEGGHEAPWMEQQSLLAIKALLDAAAIPTTN
ncbi:MAG: alpha/beta hydrolase [Clostridiales bacterium]|nr:alpha/beta hydrolase [Clostridiales bacterium]